MTRGQKGCYVYCTDTVLDEYFQALNHEFVYGKLERVEMNLQRKEKNFK